MSSPSTQPYSPSVISHEELLLQITTTLQSEPTSEATIAFRAKALHILQEKPLCHNPFPEGTEVNNLPEYSASYQHFQALSPDKQSKIFYYEKNGEWFITIDGTKISMQNELVPDDRTNGVYTENGNDGKEHTWFSEPAALAHSKITGQNLPTLELWRKMATFLGGFGELNDILQIPPMSLLDRTDGLNAGVYIDVWAGLGGDYSSIVASGGSIHHASNAHYGHGVRLLDK